MISHSSLQPFSVPLTPPREIDYTLKENALPATYAMNSGPCTVIENGTRCACSRGLFLLEHGVNFELLICKTKTCHHLLKEHRAADNEPPPTESSPTESSPTESSASAGNPNYTQQHSLGSTRYETRCLRQDTVSKLAAAVDSQNVIHIRGTPASGKTVLSQLLLDYYLTNNRKAFLLETWEPLEASQSGDPWTRFGLHLQQKYPEFDKTWKSVPANTVILIDEAQGSYRDTYFWNTVIKNRRSGEDKDIKICLFCSYGSPSTGVEEDDNENGFTPVTFGPAQRITLTPQVGKDSPNIGLFYTEDEFCEVVSLLTTNKFDEPFTIDKAAMDYIYDLTNGHPGGVTAMVDFLQNRHRNLLKHKKIRTITMDHVLEVLMDENDFFRFLANHAVYRSFPRGRRLTSEVADALGKILVNGSIPFDIDDAVMRKCYERGWVHRIAEGQIPLIHDVAVLPSRLHEVWLEWFMGNKPKHLPDRFDQLRTLCREVLENFSKISLRHAAEGKKISTAAKPRPMEAQYQDEFYRAFCNVAGIGVPLCSEWSRSGNGRVDFYIPQKQWAIELLRDYDRVDEHISRFYPGGKYFSWLQEKKVVDWVIINCASSSPTRPYSEQNLWTAVFTNCYSDLKVYDHQMRPLFSVPLHN
ncbi:uncharacterized protein BDV14DRAFT_184292 [Aspergillus stella-maris]|uniref:uncharacterized protein n=1 Tax=Aspergillus stella-maris TaxID=1810926 RepID=UPI003CCDF364